MIRGAEICLSIQPRTGEEVPIEFRNFRTVEGAVRQNGGSHPNKTAEDRKQRQRENPQLARGRSPAVAFDRMWTYFAFFPGGGFSAGIRNWSGRSRTTRRSHASG